MLERTGPLFDPPHRKFHPVPSRNWNFESGSLQRGVAQTISPSAVGPSNYQKHHTNNLSVIIATPAPRHLTPSPGVTRQGDLDLRARSVAAEEPRVCTTLPLEETRFELVILPTHPHAKRELNRLGTKPG